MLEVQQFTGGVLDTNAFLLMAPEGAILIDAPQDAASHFEHSAVKLLLITHGHFDHIADAAALKKRSGCSLACHAETVPMITDPNFFRNWGFALEAEPVHPDLLLTESPCTTYLGLEMQIFEVPGHCPGSLCFYLPKHQQLYTGDVLFREGLGRWDLPGGNKNALLQGTRKMVSVLPPETQVFPGHGPMTTIGHELAHNPWLKDLVIK